MRPIAFRLFFAFALIGCHAAPVLAGDAFSDPRSQISDSSLPAFVPPSGKGHFATASADTRAATQEARRAAETLSAKFSDATTNTIVQENHPASAAPPDPPHVATTPDAMRSIVLASTGSDGKNLEARKSKTHSLKQRRLHPRNSALRKATPKTRRGNSGATGANLAAIGEKVSVLDLLTNPALWH